jgi:hypothetical protein
MYIGIAVNMSTGIKHYTTECCSRAKARTLAVKLKKFHHQAGEVIVILTRVIKEEK